MIIMNKKLRILLITFLAFMFVGTGFLGLLPENTIPNVMAEEESICFIVNDPAALDAAYDTPFKDRMENELDLTVTLLDNNNIDADHDWSGYDAVVHSSSSGSTGATNLKNDDIPIFTMEQFATQQELGLTTGETGRNGKTTINIINATHYITDMYATGDITVYPVGETIACGGIANDVYSVVQEEAGASLEVLIICEDGDTLSDGTVAENLRIFYGVNQGDAMNEHAFLLFDRTINYLLGLDTDEQVGLGVGVSVGGMDSKEQTIRNFLDDNYTITFIDDSLIEYGFDYSGFNTLFLCAGVGNDEADALWDEDVPIGIVSHFAFADFKMGSAGTTDSDSQGRVIDNTHMITDGVASGLIDIHSSAQTTEMGSGWDGNVTVLVENNDDDTECVVAYCDDGDYLYDDSVAEARRLFFGIYRMANLDVGGNSLQMLDDGVDWLINGSPADGDAPVVSNVDVSPATDDIGETFTITCDVTDASTISSVVASVQSPDEAEVDSVTLYDDGAHGDGGAADGTYGNTWDSTGESAGTYYVDITATDEHANSGETENGDTFILTTPSVPGDGGDGDDDGTSDGGGSGGGGGGGGDSTPTVEAADPLEVTVLDNKSPKIAIAVKITNYGSEEAVYTIRVTLYNLERDMIDTYEYLVTVPANASHTKRVVLDANGGGQKHIKVQVFEEDIIILNHDYLIDVLVGGILEIIRDFIQYLF